MRFSKCYSRFRFSGRLSFRQPNRRLARDSGRNHESIFNHESLSSFSPSHPGGSIAAAVTHSSQRISAPRQGALTGAKPIGPAPPPVNWGPRYATPGPRRRVGTSPALCDVGGLRTRSQSVRLQERHVYAAIRGRCTRQRWRGSRRRRKANFAGQEWQGALCAACLTLASV